MMEENNSFVSCMKIRGVSILPPLITPERRKELLEYKKKALLLEESYQKRRLQCDTSIGDHSKHVTTETTILTSESDQCLYSENVLEVGLKYVPYQTQQKEKPNLSIDITNVYECIPLEVVELNLDECESRYKENKKQPEDCTNEQSGICQKLEDSGRPRLIRSNSYTLDNPSSILLDHLKRQSSSSCEQTLTSDKAAEDFKSWELKSHKLKDTQIFDAGTLQDMPSKVTKTRKIDIQPSLEVITTDITVQQINFTTPLNKQNGTTKKLNACEMTDLRFLEEDEKSSSTDPEIELKSILKQIPEDYAKKIMKLIEEQKKEQRRRTQNYEVLKADMLQSGDFENKPSVQISSPKKIFVNSASNPQPNTPQRNVVNNEMKNISKKSESLDFHTAMEKSIASSLNESQTLPFDISVSCSDSLDDFSLRTIRTLDLGHESHGDIINCSNQLFSEEVISSGDGTMVNYELKKFKEREVLMKREEKAASIIGAYAKGYLVRRLMNTAKVKTIIQTIQDALVCALELQSSERIEEADVELHRRLIKLVSSACFEFHDIFFALTIPEQMDLIAIDREKIKKAAGVRKTISSTDFRSRGRTSSDISNNIRSSQSLTKI